MPETGFGSAAEAAGMLDASLDYLAATDWASLGTQAHGEMLAQLQRAQAQLTAVNAAVLAAFTAQSGYEPDGHRSAMAWLVNRTKMSRGAAAGAIGWQRRLARHGVIAAAMATRKISESWGKDIATWTDPLPPLERDQADEILLEAAAAGVPLEDLRALARSIWETWKAQHPDPDDGNGEPRRRGRVRGPAAAAGCHLRRRRETVRRPGRRLRGQAAGDLRRARQAPGR